MTKYNWGIIGTGWIAHEMADALQTVKGEVYAAANPNEISLKSLQLKRTSNIYSLIQMK
jgi:predicted dehydrogenase related protein